MWIALTLACALALSLSDTLVKKALHDGVGHHAAGWLRTAMAAPFLLGILMATGAPTVKPAFYMAIAAALPFEMLALYLHTRALKASPMSLTLPFLAFTPGFIIFVAWALAGERISTAGAGGIILMMAGGYVLNINHINSGLLEPIRAIVREKGALMMLAVAAIYSITATLIKVGINSSSPLYFGCVYFILLPVAYLPFAVRQLRPPSRGTMGLLLAAGLLQFIMIITHVLAVSQIEVAYMVSVKRTSLLFGVLLGWLVFREENLRQRMLGAIIMLAGFAAVALNS